MFLPEYHDLFISKVKEYGSRGWEEVFNRVVSVSNPEQLIIFE